MRRLSVLALSTVVFAGAGLVTSCSNDEHSTDSPLPAQVVVNAQSTAPGDATRAVERPGQQARMAAVAAVGSTGDVVSAGFISRRVLIESFATPSFAPDLAERTSSQVTALLFELGDRGGDPSELDVVERPITAHVLSATDDTAVVEVWSVLVVAAPGTGPSRQVWRTVKLVMVRSDGRWLVDDWSSALGPTPALTPDASISDAATVGWVLDWSPAMSGGR